MLVPKAVGELSDLNSGHAFVLGQEGYSELPSWILVIPAKGLSTEKQGATLKQQGKVHLTVQLLIRQYRAAP